jgi:hypothetical protein
MEVNGLLHVPTDLPPEKKPDTHCIWGKCLKEGKHSLPLPFLLTGDFIQRQLPLTWNTTSITFKKLLSDPILQHTKGWSGRTHRAFLSPTAAPSSREVLISLEFPPAIPSLVDTPAPRDSAATVHPDNSHMSAVFVPLVSFERDQGRKSVQLSVVRKGWSCIVQYTIWSKYLKDSITLGFRLQCEGGK